MHIRKLLVVLFPLGKKCVKLDQIIFWWRLGHLVRSTYWSVLLQILVWFNLGINTVKGDEKNLVKNRPIFIIEIYASLICVSCKFECFNIRIKIKVIRKWAHKDFSLQCLLDSWELSNQLQWIAPGEVLVRILDLAVGFVGLVVVVQDPGTYNSPFAHLALPIHVYSGCENHIFDVNKYEQLNNWTIS